MKINTNSGVKFVIKISIVYLGLTEKLTDQLTN